VSSHSHSKSPLLAKFPYHISHPLKRLKLTPPLHTGTYLPQATPTGGSTPYTFLDMTTAMFDATYIGQFYRGTSNTFFDITTPPCQAIQLCANAAYAYSQNPDSFRLYQDLKTTNDRWECDIGVFLYYSASDATNVPDDNVGLQFHYSM